MKRPSFKFRPLRTIPLLAATLLMLFAIDGLLTLQDGDSGGALASFGNGTSAQSSTDSLFAFFLLGMVCGLVLGIGLFFAHLLWREKRLAEEPDEVGRLLDEIAREEEEAALLREEAFDEEPAEPKERRETLDPWERPSDWWKSGGE